jgi:hypothetical protein
MSRKKVIALAQIEGAVAAAAERALAARSLQELDSAEADAVAGGTIAAVSGLAASAAVVPGIRPGLVITCKPPIIIGLIYTPTDLSLAAEIGTRGPLEAQGL